MANNQATLEAYQALETFVDAGKLRQLGVSNCYDPKTLEWLIGQARIKVSVVQNRWYEGNGFDWGGERSHQEIDIVAALMTVYELCQERSIRYQYVLDENQGF